MLSHPAWVCGLKPWWGVRNWQQRRSHPAWVCGLKQHYVLFLMVGVKSHPAWVCGLKHGGFFIFSRSGGHTLRGCVDWNPLIERQITKQDGHTLRGCVDWNLGTTHHLHRFGQSHPAWVCGLKRSSGLSGDDVLGHTLRGCVDWNALRLAVRSGNDTSHPAWVCGLKL